MKLKKNKKAAIALSVNMLVVIILAIVIFSFGIGFLYNIMSKAFQLKGVVDEDLDRQMETILCDKPVCLSSTYKKIYRKEYEVVGLRIYNTLPTETDFTVSMAFAGAFNKSGGDIDIGDIDDYIIYIVGVEGNTWERTVTLNSRTEKGIGIGIEVRKNAVPGTYVFNIKVEADGAPYPPPQQVRIEVP